ncbi:hypothetical protein VEE68_23830 [Escherichia coli]|nr:hypothetical protein VEE68_23830 [Escherichia coli]
MAFKIWQIGLHLQQQEAVAVAIVRGAKECFLQRWWRLPLENDIIKDGRIVDAQQLAKTVVTLESRTAAASSHYVGVSRQSHITAVISAPVDVPW